MKTKMKCSYFILQRVICNNNTWKDLPKMTQYVNVREEKWIKNFWVSACCPKYSAPKLSTLYF